MFKLISTSKWYSFSAGIARLGGSASLELPSLYTDGPDQILPATDHRTWLPDGTVKLQIPSHGPQSIPPISVPTMFRRVVEDLPNHLALGAKGPSGQKLRWTYSDYHRDVTTAAKAFIALGLERFHSVGILGFNSPEWVISSLAAVHAGGFATGIYQTNSPQACQYVADNSRANIIVVEDDIQLTKILTVKNQLPHLRAIIQYKGKPHVPGVISWKELMELGTSASDGSLDERLKQIALNQCCLLVYTSGTTGNPKGVMLSHDSASFAQSESAKLFGWEYGKEVLVSYLPLSHLAGTMMDIYPAVARGATVYFADPNALKGTLIENLKEYKPTKFMGVPRIWEKIEEKMKEVGKNNRGAKKMVSDWAKSMGTRHHEILMNGGNYESLGYRMAKVLVFKKVHAALGMDAVKAAGSGGAFTPESTHRYFRSLDLQLYDIYGASESNSLIAANLPGPGNYRLGTVGREFPLMENKIDYMDEDGIGEMHTRGRSVFMGYLNNKKETLKTIDDYGWLHTGDLVKMDKDGFYSVVGRIKEIVITSGGENITPANIEHEIKTKLQEIISNVMVVGDGRKFLTCLITLRVEVDPVTMSPTNILEPQARQWIAKQGGGNVLTVSDVIDSEGWSNVKAAIQNGIDEANQRAVSNAATIKKWRILPKEFSIEGRELTPTLKLKRYHVQEMYRDLINQMYDVQEEQQNDRFVGVQ